MERQKQIEKAQSNVWQRVSTIQTLVGVAHEELLKACPGDDNEHQFRVTALLSAIETESEAIYESMDVDFDGSAR